MVKYNSAFGYEAGERKGQRDKMKLDIIIVEEAGKKFNVDPIVINKIIRKIKNGEA
jgi:hypothetical protein